MIHTLTKYTMLPDYNKFYLKKKHVILVAIVIRSLVANANEFSLPFSYTNIDATLKQNKTKKAFA
jgi:hypothetical protein